MITTTVLSGFFYHTSKWEIRCLSQARYHTINCTVDVEQLTLFLNNVKRCANTAPSQDKIISARMMTVDLILQCLQVTSQWTIFITSLKDNYVSSTRIGSTIS